MKVALRENKIIVIPSYAEGSHPIFYIGIPE